METGNNCLALSKCVEESSSTRVRVCGQDNIIRQPIGLNDGEEVSVIKTIGDPRESSAAVLCLGKT